MLLKTERLRLRTLNPTHAEMVQNYLYRNEQFFKPWLPAYTHRYFELDFIESWLKEEQEELRKRKKLHLFIFQVEDENQVNILGDIVFYNIEYGVCQFCSLGYKIDEKAREKGYTQEALEKAIKYIFEEWKLHRIEANIMPNNLASLRLIEKLGFETEGLAKKLLKINGKWEDHWRYSLLNEETQKASLF